MSSPFTLTIDWLAFTLPIGSAHDTMQVLGGEWTKSEVGFRRYPRSWITAGVGRGIGKLGTGAPRAPREVHVDLSGGIVASCSIEKVRTTLQWVLSRDGHFTKDRLWMPRPAGRGGKRPAARGSTNLVKWGHGNSACQPLCL